jgi:transposase-like protein
MTKKNPTPKYTTEFRERGVRLYREQRPGYASDTAAYKAITSKLGCSPDTLRAWCVQAARDAGERDGMTSEEKAHLKALERENKALRQANQIKPMRS